MNETEYYQWRLAGTNHPGPGRFDDPHTARKFGEDWIRTVGKREPGPDEVEVWRHLVEKIDFPAMIKAAAHGLGEGDV